MAADSSNGKLVEPAKKGMNGHAKSPIKSKPVPKPKGFSLFSTISRLFTWYSIITILLRCPATGNLLLDSSPRICKPYFQLRAVVSPQLQPYYDVYAAPYVDAARPYYNVFDQNFVIPATALGKKYGAPRVEQAQAFTQAQWQKNVQPQVSKYQAILKEKYDQTLGPHVSMAVDSTAPYYDIAKANALQTYYEQILPTYTTVQPYVSHGYGLASEFAVGTALPYTQWAWTTSADFLDRTVWPRVRILYGENVEPQLVKISERLGRYRDGKKLMSAVDQVDSSAESALTSSIATQASSVASSIANAIPSTNAPAGRETIQASLEVPSSVPESEVEIRAKAQKIVAHDLKTWQEKFAKAADEGSDALEERITEITERLIQNQAKEVGNAYVVELEEAIKSSLKGLKSSIISIVKTSQSEEEAEEALNAATRKAGASIKEKALAVRQWRQEFDHETNTLISESAQNTFEILDHIRDLGLQEIGMRWAWTDGITHKDWSKYHQLKTKFDEWRYDVEKVATEHPGLEQARTASEEIESRAMGIAEQAAKELARLKETGRWKISAHDSTNDFNTKHMPAAAAVAGKKVMDKINDLSDAVAPSSQGSVESIASVASSSIQKGASAMSSIASSMASSVTGSSQGTVESVLSAAGASISSLSDEISSTIIGTSQGTMESIVSVAKSSASSVIDQASSTIIGTSQGTMESIASVAGSSASSLSAKASSSIVGKEPGLMEKASESIKSAASVVSESASSFSEAASSSISSVSSDISSGASAASSSYTSLTSSVSKSLSKSASDASSFISSSASSASSTASKKVFGGAMAQFVEAKQIIFEDEIQDSDDDTLTEKIQSVASQAGDRYSDITRAVSEALMGPTPTPDAMTKIASDKYSSALSAASVAYYGTEQGTGESISSVVSSRYSDAVAAASSIIYGTPMPITDSMAAQATLVYNSALSAASEQYSRAMSAVSAQISGEPKPVHEEMFSSVENAYSQFVASANSRFQAGVSAASTAAYGTPTPAYQSALASMSAMAQSRLSEGLSAASAQYSAAKSYAYGEKSATAENQKLLAQMQEQYYAGVGMAHARYSEFMEAASSAVMPTQTPTPMTKVLADGASAASSAIIGSETPWTESVASAASENWEALITKASMQIYGAPTPYIVTRSLMSGASAYAAQATDGIAAQYSAVQSLVSELVSGKEPDFTESVYKRLSSAYYTGAGQVASSASSYASEAYASASSVVSAVFTPPPTLEVILNSAASRVNEAVDAASVQLYGTTKGSYEQAVESASSAYSSVSSALSERVYGSSAGYVEAAQSSIADAASSAQSALSAALYGTPTPTGTYNSITSAAGEAYASATSVVADNMSAASSMASENYSAAHSAVSSAIYGPEKGALESAQLRLEAAVESARIKLAGYASAAGEGASAAASQASAGIEDFASSVSSAVSAATGSVKVRKDEL